MSKKMKMSNKVKKMMPNENMLNKILIGVLVLVVIIIIISILNKSNALESFTSKPLHPSKGEVNFVMFGTEWCPHCQNAKP